MPINVMQRGETDDTVLYQLLQTISSAPVLSVLLGMHQDSAGLRALRTDAQGRLLVNNGTGRLQIVNTVLADTSQQVVTGAGVYRKCVFYAQNANLNLSFKLQDLTVTPEITVVPNVPLTVEAVFLAVLARNSIPGVPATLQAVVQSDLLAGQ
jgi:hypothetical protein